MSHIETHSRPVLAGAARDVEDARTVEAWGGKRRWAGAGAYFFGAGCVGTTRVERVRFPFKFRSFNSFLSPQLFLPPTRPSHRSPIPHYARETLRCIYDYELFSDTFNYLTASIPWSSRCCTRASLGSGAHPKPQCPHNGCSTSSRPDSLCPATTSCCSISRSRHARSDGCDRRFRRCRVDDWSWPV